ncbi:hypothetical protein D3C85_1471400 [compost metagenome]
MQYQRPNFVAEVTIAQSQVSVGQGTTGELDGLYMVLMLISEVIHQRRRAVLQLIAIRTEPIGEFDIFAIHEYLMLVTTHFYVG